MRLYPVIALLAALACPVAAQSADYDYQAKAAAASALALQALANERVKPPVPEVNDGWSLWFTETLRPGETQRFNSHWNNTRPAEFRVVSAYSVGITDVSKVLFPDSTWHYVTVANNGSVPANFTVQFRYTDQRPVASTTTTPGCVTGCNCSVTGICTCPDCPNGGGKASVKGMTCDAQGNCTTGPAMSARTQTQTRPTYIYTVPQQSMYYGGRFSGGGGCSSGSCR